MKADPLQQLREKLSTYIIKMKGAQQLESVEQSYLEALLASVWGMEGEATCMKFVSSYCTANNVEVKPNGIFRGGDLVRNHRAFFYRMHEAWKIFARDQGYKLSEINRDTIALEFDALLEQEWEAKRHSLRETLKPIDDPDAFDAMLLQLTTAICGKVYPDPNSVDFRRSMAFIGHYFYQVQMKLHYGVESILRQGNESMLLLVSQQQKTGKSTTVRHLLNPLNKYGFVWKTDFTRLEDVFSLQNLAYNYAAWFDDAGRSSMKNMSRFKQIVTDDEVNFRAMYTQTEMRLPKLATLIGTSNKTARELLPDSTGLRRIHQVMVNNESVDKGGGIDLDTVTQLDIVHLMKCTPLGPQASPLFRYITPTELTLYEESIRPRHLIELWADDMGYAPGTKKTGQLKSLADLFKSCTMWAGENGYSNRYQPTSESFKQKLIELGYKPGRNGRCRGFYVIQSEDEIF